jgi:hypothetical protein
VWSRFTSENANYNYSAIQNEHLIQNSGESWPHGRGFFSNI